MSIYFLSPTIDIERSVKLEKILRGAIPDLIKIENIEEIFKGTIKCRPTLCLVNWVASGQ